jgi:hypothetical protein
MIVQEAIADPLLSAFHRVWLVSFVFVRPTGDRPTPMCCIAQELKTERTICRWLEGACQPCPYDLDNDALVVCCDAADTLGCHLALGWPLPRHTLDLLIEFRLEMNGRLTNWPEGVAGAAMAHGLDLAKVPSQRHLRLMAQRGGIRSRSERETLLQSCEAGTQVLRQLLLAMLPRIDVPRALYRGRYAVALARVDCAGVPIDVLALQALQDNWQTIRERLVQHIDREFGVFRAGRFNEGLWLRWVVAHGLSWPRHRDGRLYLDEATFRRMAERYPEVEPIRALRSLLSQLKDYELPVGTDGRTRCPSRAFATITGRHAPRGKECLFLWPAWCRGLIQAPPGRALGYLDYEQSEYLVAGALAKDEQMIADYRAGDCYVSLGRSLGLIPTGGTAASHPEERRLCKIIALAVNYGIRPASLARRIRQPLTVAAGLLRRHAERYSAFWRWSNATVDFARFHGWLSTKFGWTYQVPRGTQETTLRNWRVQATGAEVLRAAVCALDDARITIGATVHDAVLIEADMAQIDGVVAEAESRMIRASAAVLGEPLRVGQTILQPGERLLPAGRARRTWELIWSVLRDEERACGRTAAAP